MVKVVGGDRVSRKLQAVARKSPKLAGQIAFVAADELKADVIRSITEGSVSGAGHIPSKPGEPPNNDTGALKNSIQVVKKGRLTYEVTAGSPSANYALALEEGTRRMKKRPYMEPAAKRLGNRVEKLADKALKKFLRRTK